MKYIDDFRNSKHAKAVSDAIRKEAKPNKQYKFMEFCGGHTHAVYRYGIPNLLPKNIELVHGPGCPVCVLPIARVDLAVAIAKQPGVIFCSYGDMLRVPGSRRQSLLKSKAEGADVRMVYSVDDALQISRLNPTKKIVFFAIGFETTTPPTAVAIKTAVEENLSNFLIFCNHVLTPPALDAILSQDGGANLSGFIGPAHVSVVIGSNAYVPVSRKYQKPIVISGFEPLDVLHSILMLIRQINDARCEVENQYTRAVEPQGNTRSQQIMQETLELCDQFEWRGLGWIPNSALKIKHTYSFLDAEKQFKLPTLNSQEYKACECPAILRGQKKPTDCKVFGTVCTPENPIGSCMVSSEGACAAYYNYTRHG